MFAGLDLGSSLHKVALASDAACRDLELSVFPAGDTDAALAFVRARDPSRVAVSGGRAEASAGACAPTPALVVSEFDAWARGAAYLATRGGSALVEPYLVVSLGTGTSILLIANGQASRVGGTPLGGGTLLGLGELLVGTEHFDRLVALAARGSRAAVDLRLGDVYPEISVPDFTASHFGKLRSRRPEDIAQALVGLVAENVALMAVTHAAAHAVTAVVYAGST